MEQLESPWEKSWNPSNNKQEDLEDSGYSVECKVQVNLHWHGKSLLEQESPDQSCTMIWKTPPGFYLNGPEICSGEILLSQMTRLDKYLFGMTLERCGETYSTSTNPQL